MGLQQYISVTPWDGLRFGTMGAPASGEFHRAHFAGHIYDVTIGPALTSLVRDGTPRLRADAAVIVRKYVQQPAQLSFTIRSRKGTRVSTEEFASGILRLSIDNHDRARIAVQSGRCAFEVPEGEHKVELRQ